MLLLKEWARSRLSTGLWKDALTSAASVSILSSRILCIPDGLFALQFILPRFTTYQVICERLEMTDRVADAVSCFCQLHDELAQEIKGERANWTRGERSCMQYRIRLIDYPPSDFESRCRGKLEDLGDIAMNNEEYDEAISQYTTALFLDPATKHVFLVKRSKAHVRKGKWDAALKDANEVALFFLPFALANGASLGDSA